MQNEQLVCMAMGYLAGSFLTAVFVARTFTEKEISQIGTGNPGMANVMANIGKKEGVLVLAGDLVKVVIACRICQLFFPEHSFEEISLYTGFGAILGHNYPLWRKGKGRKRSGCDLRVADTGIFSLWFFVLYCWRGSSASHQKPCLWCGCDPVFWLRGGLFTGRKRCKNSGSAVTFADVSETQRWIGRTFA